MDDLDLAIDNAVPTSVQARRATVAAEPQDQDAAAKAYEIAPKVGLPPSIVQYNANAFEQDLKRSVDGAVLDGNPKLQQFIIDDPTRAVAAKGGYQELDKISKIADPMPNLELQTDYGFQSLPEELPGKSAYEGLARGWQERQFGTLAYRQMMGEEGLEPALQSYEKQMGTQDEYKGFDYLVNSLAGLVGNLGASAAVSAPAVGGGAAVGAAAGGPAGAVAGAGAGLTAGVLADQFKTQAGSFFRDSGKILDRNGNPLPVEIRKTMALGVASVNTALMGAAPAAAHAGISAIMSEAALRAIAEPGVLQALYRGLTKAGLGSLEFGAINTGMEASQIAATEIGKAVSGQNFDTVLNDPAQREAAVQRVSQGLINGLTLGTVLPFTPLGTNYLRDRIAVAQSGFEARQRELMHDAVQNSEVFKKSPTLVADWLRVHEGLEDVMVPAEEVAKRREEFGYVPDLDAQLEAQLPLGGDVKIPAADYYTKTPEETGKALNDVIRGPSGVTVEEAKDLQENPPDYMAKRAVEAPADILRMEGEGAQTQEALERTTEQIMAGMNLQPTGKPNFLSSIMEKETTGLSKRPFEQLAQRVQEVQREITQKAYDVAYRELMRREKPLYKNQLTLETARAREDLEKRPDILAYQAMVNLPKDNEFSIKLDRNEVDGLYNRESPADYAAFQKGTRASESFPNKMFAKDGLHPDEAATLVGFSSGKEMLDHLREYESNIRASGLSERKYLDGLGEAEGQRRMEEKDNLNERVSAEAIDLALSVKQVDVLIAEMHALVPGEETKLTRGAVEEAAERNFGQLNSKKVKSADFERQVAKWGREAFRFSNADKPVEALKALQKQLSNFLMAREAKAFEKERDRAEKIMGRFQANRSLENVTQEYTDYAHSILARMDRPIPVDIRDLEDRLANKSFLQFVSDERNKGLDIADTSWLHDPTGLPRLDDLNVEQYRQLADTFESLYNKGKEQKVIEIGDKQLERDIVKERLVRYLKGVTYDRGRVIDGKATGAWNNFKWVGRELDATVREPQYIIKRIDNDDPLGPWTQDIYRPIYDRLNQRDDRLRDVAERFAELYDDEWARASENLVTNSFRDLNNKPMQITNAQKLVMLLNSGNDRNMRLLAHTLSEDVDTVREWLKQNVTEKDLKIAHGVLDLFENLWPDLKDMTRRVSGVSPAKVRARGYDTPVGRFEGGYFPSLADPDMVDLKGESDLFDRRWFDPATDSRAAHERTGALYPLSFDLNRLPYVVRQTVHDIYMREPVSNAWSFMNDREIKSAFTDAWGPEYTRQLKPWLSYVANDGGVPTFDGLWTPYKWSREARRNAVAVLVGGRPSTALIHGGSALAQSVTEVGLRPFVKEAWNVMTRSEEAGTTAWNNSMGLSSALRNRMHNIYTSLESEVPHILNQSNARQEYLAFSTRLIAALDQWSAVVVFRARMKQALDAGMSTDEAIWTANRSVDIAHGSNTLVNRPAVMRGGEGSKWFTQFMGFFNNTYNRGRDIGVKVSQGKYMEAMIGTLGFLAASAAVHTVVRYNQKDPVWKQALESGADVTVGGIPVVRDAFRGIIHGGDYGESMMTTMTKGITQPVAEWGKFATGGKAPKDWVSHLLMAPGFGMGFLPGVTGAGPKFLTGHAGDWLTLATTKTGSGHAQYLWDRLYRHSLEPPDIRRGILEGNWHQRKAGH